MSSGPGHHPALVSGVTFDAVSALAQFGTYGSAFSATTIWNHFGSYGSPYNALSACDQYTSTPPVILDEHGCYVGLLTVN